MTGLSFGKLLPEITSQIKGLMQKYSQRNTSTYLRKLRPVLAEKRYKYHSRPAKKLNTGKSDSSHSDRTPLIF